MKIYCAGAEADINQIGRIREGFKSLGHTVSSLSEADLIFCNDPSSYNSEFRLQNSDAPIIYNVLDLPPHCINGDRYDISRYPPINNPWPRVYNPLDLKSKFSDCDLVTCICEEVQWQLKNWCDTESKVIYNPIKDVSFLNLSEEKRIKNRRGVAYKYLYVGRANDPNKRFNIVAETMNILGEASDLLAVVGSENPSWGDYYGIVNDKVLNLFYNSVEYFFFPSAFKSVGLPALESVVTKTKTIVCDDDPTSAELWPDIGVPSDPINIAQKIKSREWNQKWFDFVEEYSMIYKSKFDKKTIAANILKEAEKL